MSNFEQRKDLFNKFQTLVNQLTSFLENQQKNSDQETNYSLYGDEEGTTGIISDYISKLQNLKCALEFSEQILYLIPLEKEKFQIHLNESLIQRSKLGSSILISNFINQNSEIERAKIDDLHKKLSLFIKNYSESNHMICSEHNQKAEFIDLSNDKNIIDRRVCINCDKIKVRLTDLLEQYLMQFFNFKIQSDQKRIDIKKQIESLFQQIRFQKNIENLYIDKDKLFQKRIDIIDEILKSQNIDLKLLSDISIDFVQTQTNFINYSGQFMTKLEKNLQQEFIIVQNQLNYLLNSLSQGKIQIIDSGIKQSYINDQQLIYTKLGQQEQSEKCQALCFNKDDKLIATAKKNVIIIWSFQGGKMIWEKELNGHYDEISCLLFNKDSDALISAGGDQDRQINLWEKTYIDEWKLSKSYQNIGGIKVMLLNKKGDELIVGTQKGQILRFKVNFHMLTLELIKEYQIDQNQKPIFGLSLNDEQKYLVQCGQDKILRLISFDQNIEIQLKLLCTEIGMRIKFINNTSFVLVQKDGLLIYYKIEWQKFTEIQRLNLNSINQDYSYSPIWYNSDKKLLIVKHNKSIHFLKLIDGKFVKIHFLTYKYSLLFATISNNGQYLVTWIGKHQNEPYDMVQHDIYQIYELEYQ
ncbi:unnamed protein product [Paramecium pentaurelia]|uniref:WD40-repeat-containing domain n=1 Tax=Paramecium pentaurelia TaxID=43138 RepID=A0A8S1UW00_9CILI|nr:unnamed protein product [Paramecium pentaurelia]